MSSDLETKLKRALEKLDKASQDFRLKQANFAESGPLEALRELIKEQGPNESSMHPAREAR